MKIDLSKPVQTRDGRPARVVSEKGVGAFPVLALVTGPDGAEHILRYTPAGNAMLAPGQTADDLVNVVSVSYRTAKLEGGDIRLGTMRMSSPEAARKLITEETPWDAVLRITESGGQLFDVEVVNA